MNEPTPACEHCCDFNPETGRCLQRWCPNEGEAACSFYAYKSLPEREEVKDE